MDFQKINLNGFEFTFKDDGSWIYKAIPFSKVQKPIEKPQLRVVEDIEAKYKKLFDTMLFNTVREVTKYLAV
jgi:hypothetical protein